MALISPLLQMSRATWNRHELAWDLSAGADSPRVHAVADERPFGLYDALSVRTDPGGPTLERFGAGSALVCRVKGRA